MKTLIALALSLALVGCSNIGDIEVGDLVQVTNHRGLCGTYVANTGGQFIVRSHATGDVYAYNNSSFSYIMVKVEKC